MEADFQDVELALPEVRTPPRPSGARPGRRRGPGSVPVLARFETFEALSVRNYRLYFTGQVVSLAGTWMQQVAQALLVLRLTGDGTALGVVVTLQMVPILLLTVPAGALVDRLPRRPLILVSQTGYVVSALALALLTATGAIELWMVYAFAASCGVIQAIDDPARQSFVGEMVGGSRLANAVSLNGVMVNLARVVGPAIAGALVVTVGVAACFLVNALSYVGVIVALLLMRRDELLVVPPTPRARMRDGLAYVRRTQSLLVPLLLLAAIGVFTWEFQVTLPLLAERVFHDGALFGTLFAVQGVGAVVSGLIVAARYRGRRATTLGYVTIALGITILGVASSPTLAVALGATVLMGAAGIAYISITNMTLQLNADPSARGRVMALWSMCILGGNAIGGPIVGWIGEHVGARYSLGIGGVVAVVGGLLSIGPLRRVDSPTLTTANLG